MRIMKRNSGKGVVEAGMLFSEDISPAVRVISKGYSLILQTIWFPLLITGLISAAEGTYSNDYFQLVWLAGGVIAGWIIGCCLHEFSHAAAAWAAGEYVYGIFVSQSRFRTELYTLIVCWNPCSWWDRGRIHSAGIRSNLLLCGGGLLVGSSTGMTFALGFAFENLLIAALSLLGFGRDSDGDKIVSRILETGVIKRRGLVEGIHTVMVLLFVNICLLEVI